MRLLQLLIILTLRSLPDESDESDGAELYRTSRTSRTGSDESDGAELYRTSRTSRTGSDKSDGAYLIGRVGRVGQAGRRWVWTCCPSLSSSLSHYLSSSLLSIGIYITDRPLAGRRNRGYLLGDPYRGRDARVGRCTSVTASRMTDAYGASTPPRCPTGSSTE